ncbi:unnamed protein product [[Candida] boidinii]|nr:unnamed protein product [[Candida] boidinii]
MEIYDELERLFTTRDEQVVKDTIELLKSQILPKLNILKDDANKYHELKKIFRLPSVTNLALLSNQYKKTNKKRYNIDMENELFNDEFVFHTITSKDKFNSKIQFKNEFDEFKKKIALVQIMMKLSPRNQKSNVFQKMKLSLLL